MAGEPTGLTPAPTITINAPTTLPTGVQLQPSWDPLDLLPSGPPQDRLRLLRQHSLDLHAITVPHADLQAAAAAKVTAENALKRLVSHPHEFGLGLPVTAPQVIAANKTLDRASAEFERVKARSEARAASWRASSQAMAACEDWLKNGRPSGVMLQDFDGPVPKLNKGESLLDAIERLRRRTRELRADLHRVESSPYPSSHAKRRLREIVEQLSREPDVSLLIEHDREVIWPTSRQQAEVYGTERALAFHEAVDVVGLLAFLLKPTLVAALDKLVDEASDDKAALTHEQRQLRTDELQRDLLAVERDEAALVWRAMDEKLPVWFRADISPQAVLGVELVFKPNGHLPETTPGQSYEILRPGGGRRR